MTKGNGMNGSGHEVARCPVCRGPLVDMDARTDTSGMNAVCDTCLRPSILRIARELQRSAGTSRVRLLDIEHSEHSRGTYVKIWMATPLAEVV